MCFISWFNFNCTIGPTHFLTSFYYCCSRWFKNHSFNLGGNLSVGLFLKCVELDLPRPDCLFLFYPSLLCEMFPSPSRLICLIDPMVMFPFLMRWTIPLLTFLSQLFLVFLAKALKWKDKEETGWKKHSAIQFLDIYLFGRIHFNKLYKEQMFPLIKPITQS